MNILAENVYALHRNMMMDVDEGKRVELLEALQASSMWSTCTSHEYAHAKTRLKFADLVSWRGGFWLAAEMNGGGKSSGHQRKASKSKIMDFLGGGKKQQEPQGRSLNLLV